MTTPTSSNDREAQLANRATLLTLGSLCAFLLALITMPLTFQRTDATGPRLAASAPLAVGFGVGIAARSARAQLRVFRDEAAAGQDGSGDRDASGAAPRA